MNQQLTKLDLKIYGMTDSNSEVLIRHQFMLIAGVEKVYAHYKSGKVEIYFTIEPTISQLEDALKEYKFKVVLWTNRGNEKPETLGNHMFSRNLLKFLPIVILVAGIYLVFNKSNFSFQIQNVDSINLWVIFITGLTVGGLTCLAVQGGLLASVIAAREEESALGKGTAKHAMYATSVFLIT